MQVQTVAYVNWSDLVEAMGMTDDQARSILDDLDGEVSWGDAEFTLIHIDRVGVVIESTDGEEWEGLFTVFGKLCENLYKTYEEVYVNLE